METQRVPRRTWRDRWLDRSVVFSYDRHGFQRHARHFQDGDAERDLTGRIALVTGCLLYTSDAADDSVLV